MEGFTKLHKSKPAKFYDLNKKRQDASVQLNRRRKDNRAENFNLRRNIPEVVDVKQKGDDHVAGKWLERKLALKKYQTKREHKRNKEKENKKPPFVVGIPHHGSSPLLKNIPNVKADTCNHAQRNEELGIKRVTRAMSKLPQKGNVTRDFDKIKPNKNIKSFGKNKPISYQCLQSVKVFPLSNLVPFHPPRILSVKKLTSPHTPTVLKRSVQKTKEALKTSNQIRCHLYSRQNTISKGRTVSNDSEELLATLIPSVENVGNEQISADLGKCALRKIKGEIEYSDVTEEPIGKPYEARSDNSTAHFYLNEFKKENGVDNNSINASNSSQNDGKIPDTYGAEFQRNRLEQETARLMGLAQEWGAISQLSVDLPSDTVDEIDSVVGQTRLLINDKFNQFHKLIEEYDSKNGSQIITSEDLNGFWDMMYLQVNSLIKRYDGLEKLKNLKWVKQSPAMKKKRGRPSKLKLKIKATSSIKDFIKARRFEAVVLPSDEVCTPLRKSLRILGKTPTPIKPDHCIVCQSPLSTDHHLNQEQKSTKCQSKFLLRPSKLVVKDITNNFKGDISRTPLRRSERKPTDVLDKSGDGNTGTEVEDCLHC